MSDPTSPRGGFASRLGFVLAAAGSAVGLGNIWKFPYITGEYGGGAFVIVYLACILLVGLPLMYAELIIGRRGGKDVLGSLRTLTAGSRGGSALSWAVGRSPGRRASAWGSSTSSPPTRAVRGCRPRGGSVPGPSPGPRSWCGRAAPPVSSSST